MPCSICAPNALLRRPYIAPQQIRKPLWNAVDYDFRALYVEKLSAYAFGYLTVFQQADDPRASLRVWFSFLGRLLFRHRDRTEIRHPAAAGCLLPVFANVAAIAVVHHNLANPEVNAPSEFCANNGEPGGNYLTLSVAPDGTQYTVRVPSTSHSQTFQTRQ